MTLEARTFLVTGAGSGIGAATSSYLRDRGARVLGADVTFGTDSAADQWHLDLRDRASIDDFAAQLPTELDGMANIAGLPPTAPPGDVLKVNLRGLQRLTTALIPRLRDGGSIVNLVSSAGNRWKSAVSQIVEFEDIDWEDIDRWARDNDMQLNGRSYFFSKEALLVWTMRNRSTWAARSIRMNAVSPGPIDTPILADFIETLGPRAQRSIDATERLGTPEDVAPVVAFLLSHESRWLRGANVTPDGGLSAHMLLSEHGLE